MKPIITKLLCRARAVAESRHAPTPTDKVELGRHASRLLADPVLQLAFERVAGDLVATWRNTKLADQAQREEAYRLLWALEGVKTKLKSFTGNGKLIEAEMRRRDAEAKLERGRD